MFEVGLRVNVYPGRGGIVVIPVPLQGGQNGHADPAASTSVCVKSGTFDGGISGRGVDGWTVLLANNSGSMTSDAGTDQESQTAADRAVSDGFVEVHKKGK